MLLASEPSPEMFGSLPNISGTSKLISSLHLEDSFDGAIKHRKTSLSGGTASIGSGFVNGQIDFDASQSNSIYAGTSLQTSALQCLVCIKF